MIKKNYLLCFKIIISILSIFFLYNFSRENYQRVLENINVDLFWLILILVLRIFLHSLLSFRTFSFLKLTSNYNTKFISWSFLYFFTGLMNSTPLWGSGHLIRSQEMKQNNYSYKEYANMHYFIFFWGLLINSFILIILLTVLNNHQNIYITSSLLILFVISIPTLSKRLAKFIYQLIYKLKSQNFFLESKLFKYFINKIEGLIAISNNILRIHIFINFLIITIFLFIFEYLIFLLIFKFLFQVIDLNIVSTFFILNYLIKKIPSLDALIGFKESLLGLYFQYLGLLFVEGVIFTLFLRLLNISSILANCLIYFVLKRST